MIIETRARHQKTLHHSLSTRARWWNISNWLLTTLKTWLVKPIPSQRNWEVSHKTCVRITTLLPMEPNLLFDAHTNQRYDIESIQYDNTWILNLMKYYFLMKDHFTNRCFYTKALDHWNCWCHVYLVQFTC